MAANHSVAQYLENKREFNSSILELSDENEFEEAELELFLLQPTSVIVNEIECYGHHDRSPCVESDIPVRTRFRARPLVRTCGWHQASSSSKTARDWVETRLNEFRLFVCQWLRCTRISGCEEIVKRGRNRLSVFSDVDVSSVSGLLFYQRGRDEAAPNSSVDNDVDEDSSLKKERHRWRYRQHPRKIESVLLVVSWTSPHVAWWMSRAVTRAIADIHMIVSIVVVAIATIIYKQM